ncbi:MAG: hypothetical protein LPK11_02375 [Chromatiaceae bacterium]|nr:hypothetical protein [Chromatiaceae bacterium]
MADNFDFAALAKSWQQQTMVEEAPPSAADLTQASQRQREQKLLMYAEWLGALIMAAAAVWLWVNLPGLLGGVAALFLVVGALSTAYISWQVHRPILAYDNWSSSGLLGFRVKTCQLSLRYYRYTQLSCTALIVFTLILWLIYVLKLDDIPLNMLLFYSLLVSPVCLFAIYRLQQKVRLKTAELAQLQALLQDFS